MIKGQRVAIILEETPRVIKYLVGTYIRMEIPGREAVSCEGFSGLTALDESHRIESDNGLVVWSWEAERILFEDDLQGELKRADKKIVLVTEAGMKSRRKKMQLDPKRKLRAKLEDKYGIRKIK